MKKKNKKSELLLEQDEFYPTPEPRILPSSVGGEMNWRFPAFSVANFVELR